MNMINNCISNIYLVLQLKHLPSLLDDLLQIFYLYLSGVNLAALNCGFPLCEIMQFYRSLKWYYYKIHYQFRLFSYII